MQVRQALVRALVASFAGVASAALLPSAVSFAQELEPRAYANAPLGLNVLVANVAQAKGEIATDPSLPLQDADIEQRSAVLGYLHTLGIFGKSAKLGLILPYASLEGTALFNGQPVERSVSGLGDPRLRLSINFYGAPALSLDQFSEYRPDLVIGGSLQVSAPLGQYDSDRLVNIGTNRWSIRPELGASKTWWDGRVTTELSAGATLYTDNRDFLGVTREQEPLYAFQSHLIYRFPRGSFMALDGTFYTGGRTRVDGRTGDDRQGNSRVGITVSIPINRSNSIKLHASTGVSARTGGDFDLFSLGWQVQWSD